MKTPSQPLYLFTSCSLFELHSDKHAEVKRLIKEGERRRVELLIMSQYTLMMHYVKDTHCNGLLSVKAICIWHGGKKKGVMRRSWVEGAGGGGWRKVRACFF